MKKHKKIIKIIGNISFGIILVVMMVLVFSLGKSKISGKAPTVAGFHMYIVLSGSMNPAFDTGSLVIVKPTPPEKVKEGDIITFKGAGDSQGLTSHRVVAVNDTPQGLTYTTKGDANEVLDPVPIESNKLIGTIILAIPYLGYMMDFMRTKQGILIFVLLPAVLLILYELIKLIVSVKKEKEEKKKELAGEELQS